MPVAVRAAHELAAVARESGLPLRRRGTGGGVGVAVHAGTSEELDQVGRERLEVGGHGAHPHAGDLLEERRLAALHAHERLHRRGDRAVGQRDGRAREGVDAVHEQAKDVHGEGVVIGVAREHALGAARVAAARRAGGAADLRRHNRVVEDLAAIGPPADAGAERVRVHERGPAALAHDDVLVVEVAHDLADLVQPRQDVTELNQEVDLLLLRDPHARGRRVLVELLEPVPSLDAAHAKAHERGAGSVRVEGRHRPGNGAEGRNPPHLVGHGDHRLDLLAVRGGIRGVDLGHELGVARDGVDAALATSAKLGRKLELGPALVVDDHLAISFRRCVTGTASAEPGGRVAQRARPGGRG